MASEIKLYWLVFALLALGYTKHSVQGKPEVPCYFIFGDSLVDSGNNNNLNTKAKVNYPPYGIDFPDGPTGRFTNGRTSADIITELLGFDSFIPSFITANGSTILQGVNYASGSSGIRDESGKHLGTNIELDKQLKNHQDTIARMVDLLGGKKPAFKHLKKCLYSVVIGSNDYINNYFLPEDYDTQSKYTPDEYAKVLIDQYHKLMRILHINGARMVSLSGIGPIGCIPDSITTHGTTGSLCVDAMNGAANRFNEQLKLLVKKLNQQLSDAKFIYLSPLGFDIIPEYPASPGFEFNIQGCCRLNKYNQCVKNSNPCLLRHLYVFWDGFHPSEISNRVIGSLSYLSLKKLFE